MPQLYDITVTQLPGNFLIIRPELFGADVIHVAKNGMGYTQMRPDEGFSGKPREYAFKKTGLFAYKILFNTAVEPADGGDVHIIYSI